MNFSLKREILKTIKVNRAIDYITFLKKQSKNKKRIEDIRDELKDPTYNTSKSELKEIKKILHNTEERKKISSRKTSKYLDELDKKILTLEKYHDYKI